MMSQLDPTEVTGSLTAQTAARLTELEAFASIDSTNTYLLTQPGPGAGRFRVAVADRQTAGRGRHERRWMSPPESGLYLSLAYSFAAPPRQLSALTLALGVGIVRSLAVLGVRGVRPREERGEEEEADRVRPSAGDPRGGAAPEAARPGPGGARGGDGGEEDVQIRGEASGD